MKLPNSFRLEKDLDGKVEQLMEGFKTYQVEDILAGASQFLQELDESRGVEINYILAEEIAKGIKYTEKDFENFCKPEIVDQVYHLQIGSYVSALANKILDEDTVLTIKCDTPYMIMYQKIGTVIIDNSLASLIEAENLKGTY